MNNIKIYIYTFILLYLYSCGIEEFHFSKLKPQSSYESHPDSIKLNHSYGFDITVNDDNKTVYLLPVYDIQLCSLYLDGVLLSPNEKILFDQSLLTIKPHELGKIKYSLTFEDIYGNFDTLNFQFTCFSNLPPVAHMKLEKVGQLSDYQIIIDASKSYDKDQKYGGQIVKYKYQIDDYYSLETDRDKINHILPDKGTYTVSCQVLDNDNVWSDPVFEDVNF